MGLFCWTFTSLTHNHQSGLNVSCHPMIYISTLLLLLLSPKPTTFMFVSLWSHSHYTAFTGVKLHSHYKEFNVLKVTSYEDENTSIWMGGDRSKGYCTTFYRALKIALSLHNHEGKMENQTILELTAFIQAITAEWKTIIWVHTSIKSVINTMIKTNKI